MKTKKAWNKIKKLGLLKNRCLTIEYKSGCYAWWLKEGDTLCIHGVCSDLGDIYYCILDEWKDGHLEV